MTIICVKKAILVKKGNLSTEGQSQYIRRRRTISVKIGNRNEKGRAQQIEYDGQVMRAHVTHGLKPEKML